MPGLSLYGRDQALAAFFIPELFDAPTQVWVALCLAVPTAGDTGDDLLEPDDAAYARQPYGIGSAYWGLTGRGGVANLEEIGFGVPTQDWGNVLGWALTTDSTGGRTYHLGELAVPARIVLDLEISRPVIVGVGGLVVRQT